MPWPIFKELTDRWAGYFGGGAGLPPLVLWVVAANESSRIPGDANTTDASAIERGGAWGLFGVTLATARDLVSRIKPLAAVPVVRNWRGTGPELLDPELNTAIAAAYLATLWREFGAFVPVVASYHQGPATVRKILARGGDVATEIGPKGREYVARALTERARLEAEGTPTA